jgi:hAT family C-terminal dimerisation region
MDASKHRNTIEEESAQDSRRSLQDARIPPTLSYKEQVVRADEVDLSSRDDTSNRIEDNQDDDNEENEDATAEEYNVLKQALGVDDMPTDESSAEKAHDQDSTPLHGTPHAPHHKDGVPTVTQDALMDEASGNSIVDSDTQKVDTAKSTNNTRVAKRATVMQVTKQQPKAKRTRGLSRLDVYRFVARLYDDEGKRIYQCNLCKAVRKLQIWRSYDMDNMQHHLEKFHGDKYDRNYVPDRNNNATRRTSVLQTTEASTPLCSNRHLLRLICYWLAGHCLAFNVTKQEGFCKVMNAARPSFPVPSPEKVQKMTVEFWVEEKERVSELVVLELGGRRYCVTTDMWTSKPGDGYIAASIHYINNDWQLRGFIFYFHDVPGSHTGKAMAQSLLQGISSMSHDLLSGLWMITADNASNNLTMVDSLNNGLIANAIKAGSVEDLNGTGADKPAPTAAANSDHGQTSHLGCFAHILNLCVQYAFLMEKQANALLSAIHEGVTKIKVSSVVKDIYKGNCKRVGVKMVLPTPDEKGRWNSILTMLKTAVEVQPALDLTFKQARNREGYFAKLPKGTSHALQHQFTPDDWNLMHKIIHFLEYFDECTRIMSSTSYTTAGLIIPFWHMLLRKIDGYISQHSSDSNDNVLCQFATHVKTKIHEYNHIIARKEVIISAALDPRVKHNLGMFSLLPDEVIKTIELEWHQNYEQRYMNHKQEQERQYGKKKTGKYHVLQELSEDMSTASQCVDLLGNELKCWFALPGIDANSPMDEALEYMRGSKASFPHLAFMARDFLAIPATSVLCEEMFSKAGRIVSKNRCSLSTKTVQTLCELQSFIKVGEPIQE